MAAPGLLSCITSGNTAVADATITMRNTTISLRRRSFTYPTSRSSMESVGEILPLPPAVNTREETTAASTLPQPPSPCTPSASCCGKCPWPAKLAQANPVRPWMQRRPWRERHSCTWERFAAVAICLMIRFIFLSIISQKKYRRLRKNEPQINF